MDESLPLCGKERLPGGRSGGPGLACVELSELASTKVENEYVSNGAHK